MSPSNRVDQPSVPGVFKDHQARIAALERQVGRWSYVFSGGTSPTLAPATAPANWNPLDPLAVPYLNGCQNVAGAQPLRFRIHPATKVEIQGAIDIGANALPVQVCTLPGPGLGFWPPNPAPCDFPSTDGLAIWSGLVDSSGQVWVTAQVVAPP